MSVALPGAAPAPFSPPAMPPPALMEFRALMEDAAELAGAFLLAVTGFAVIALVLTAIHVVRLMKNRTVTHCVTPQERK